jgi:hypothetical protein
MKRRRKSGKKEKRKKKKRKKVSKWQSDKGKNKEEREMRVSVKRDREKKKVHQYIVQKATSVLYTELSVACHSPTLNISPPGRRPSRSIPLRVVTSKEAKK